MNARKQNKNLLNSTSSEEPMKKRRGKGPVHHPNEENHHDEEQQQKQKQKQPCIDRDISTKLPEELLSKIFFDGYLDTFTVVKLLSCRLSKSIQSLAKTKVFFLDLRKCLELKPKNIENVALRFTKLQCLDFTYCTQFNNDHLRRLIPLRRSLRKLFLKGCCVTDEGIREYLHSEDSEFAQHDLEEIDLSAMSLKDSDQITDSSVTAIANSCPRLTRLLLGLRSGVTDFSIPTLRKKLHYLYELDLSLTKISNDSAQLFSEMISRQNLRKLDISATKINDEGVQIIASAGSKTPAYLKPTVQTLPNDIDILLSLASNNSYTSIDDDIDQSKFESSEHKSSSKLSRFEESDQGDNHHNSDKNCSKVIMNKKCSCPIQELYIRHISLSIRSLEILSINARNLRVLNLSYCRGDLSLNENCSNSFWERVMKEFRRNGTEIHK